MDMFASCCTTSPVHQFFSYRSYLLFKMSHTAQTKNSGGNLYSYIGRYGIMESENLMCIKTAIFNQYLSKYSFSSSGIWSLPPSHKRELLPNMQPWTCFRYDSCQVTEVCASLSYRVWTQSLVVQLLYNTLLHKFVLPCMGLYTASFDGQDTNYTYVFI